jgi:hypothetical protein
MDKRRSYVARAYYGSRSGRNLVIAAAAFAILYFAIGNPRALYLYAVAGPLHRADILRQALPASSCCSCQVLATQTADVHSPADERNPRELM